MRGDEHVVEVARPDPRLFEGLDFVISAIGDVEARTFAPVVAQAGALDVDKSNAWRMDPSVPLVVPEVNPEAAREHRGIIAGPNCSTTQMVVALWPIHQVNPIQRIIVDTYQAVSGTGWRAVDELRAQVADPRAPHEQYPHQIHQNLIPEIGSYKGDGLFSEERKMIDETRKIFRRPTCRSARRACACRWKSATRKRSTSSSSGRCRPTTHARSCAQAPGVVVVDDPRHSEYPMPLTVAGQDPVYVGRIRTTRRIRAVWRCGWWVIISGRAPP